MLCLTTPLFLYLPPKHPALAALGDRMLDQLDSGFHPARQFWCSYKRAQSVKRIEKHSYGNWFLSSTLKGFLQVHQQFCFKDFLLLLTPRLPDGNSPCQFPGIPALCGFKAKARFAL